MSPLLLQFFGSLIAILLIVALVKMMRLGPKLRIDDEAAVAKAAGEVEDGFVPVRTSIARMRHAALARDTDGRIMLIKRHGNRFAGRILGRGAKAREVVDALIVECGDARFGEVRLQLTDAPYWADAINRL
ncbi:MAG: hypothetical protein WA918_04305 [Erythrobacter sp.]